MRSLQFDTNQVRNLASIGCSQCEGTGVQNDNVCQCANRTVFRICHRQYEAFAFGSRAHSVEIRGITAHRPYEEYLADFELIARRALKDTSLSYQRVFQLHFCAGVDISLCAKALKLSKYSIEAIARLIEEVAGRAFHETRPHALFPPRDYLRDSGPRKLPDSFFGVLDFVEGLEEEDASNLAA